MKTDGQTVGIHWSPDSIGYQEEYEGAPLKPNEERIKTLYSGISAGKELTFYRGTNPCLKKRWDTGKRFFISGEQSTVAYPVTNLGYEEVGEIVEVGADVTDLRIGTHLFGTWGHRTHVGHVGQIRRSNAADCWERLHRHPRCALDSLRQQFAHGTR